VIRQSLQGCIANVSVLTQAEPSEVWTPLDWSTARSYSGASAPSDGCPLLARDQKAQKAVHFLGTGKSVIVQLFLLAVLAENSAVKNALNSILFLIGIVLSVLAAAFQFF